MEEFEGLTFECNDYVYLTEEAVKEAKEINNIWYNIIPCTSKEDLCIYLVHTHKGIRERVKERYDSLNGK
jgi:hypothetical protein